MVEKMKELLKSPWARITILQLMQHIFEENLTMPG